MPDQQSIINSIGSKKLIEDPVIRNATFHKLPFGRYEMYAGGFSLVFPCTVEKEKWGFRCWFVDLGDIKDRYEKFAVDIRNAKLPYFCDFNYVENGICIDGKMYPTTRMRWVEGLNIKEYICKNKDNKDKLLKLSESFLNMCKDMHSHLLAHGDLQHGNILVNKDLKIFLVDYDSLSTPSILGYPDIIHGLASYQHPNRKDNKTINEKLDYFSELIIYMAIIAIAECPKLIDKYKVEGSENLLFTQDDYKDLEHSNIYKDLITISDEMNLLIECLKNYLSKDNINLLEPFDVLLEKYTKTPQIDQFYCRQGTKIIKCEEIILTYKICYGTDAFINGEKIDILSNQYTLKTNTKGSFTLELKVSNWKRSISKTIVLDIVDKPSFEIKPSKRMLRRGKNEHCTLKWNIQNLQSIKLKGGDDDKEISTAGSIDLSPQKTTLYTISGLALDGKTEFKEEFTINVYDESKIDFSADKSFALTSIPITLRWNVTHAKQVELDGEQVEPSGLRIIKEGIDKDRTFILRVKDEFGIKEKKILVKLLPLPVIKTLIVHSPNANLTLNVNVTIPSPIVSTELSDEFSNITELPNVEIKKIKIQRLKQFVKPNFKIPQPIHWWEFNKVYQYLKNQINKK